MNISELLDKFEGVRKSGAGWMARCPAHEDRTPSLSISEGEAGILLHCHFGCRTEDVVAAIGSTMRDLSKIGSNGSAGAAPSAKPASRIVAEYDYRDESGAPLYQNVRFEPKDFRMRRPDGAGGWTWGLGGVRRVPYRLPEIISARFVLIVEGEKDADTARGLGIVATSSKHWRPEFAEFLRGKEVAIIADADPPGRKTADEVAGSLVGKVSSLRCFELPGAKDLSDWTEAGGTRVALEGFAKAQEEWRPAVEWRSMFHSFADFENAPPLRFAIENFLQLDAATLVGGLSGHGKTLLMLSVVKALLAGAGTKLWGHFEVLETDARVLYLIPESTITPFKHRLKLFGLYDYLKDDRLLVRTLSMGATPCLSDPRILLAAKGRHVVLDTAIRFSVDGDENSAADNSRGLATDVFALLGAGARDVLGGQHSPKPFARENVMRLENVLRGSGDIGAMAATAWGIKQIDPIANVIHVENIKPRDFQPPDPFQLIGRPYIDDEGDFRMLKRPGECGALMDEQEPDRDKGGAPVQAREARAANLELLRKWLDLDPNQTSEALAERFAALGISLNSGTVRRYRAEVAKAR